LSVIRKNTMTERATGLILRTRPLTETSLIVHWLTREHGRLSTVARGARRPKSPFRGKLDLFFLGEFTFQRSRRSDLHSLHEVALIDTHVPLRQDLARLQQAAYAARLIEQTTEADTPLPEIFALVREYISALAAGFATPQGVFAFELRLLAELGLQPEISELRQSAEVKALMATLLQEDWAATAGLTLSGQLIGELDRFLHGYLAYHLGRIPHGRAQSVHPS
jgi:DNA repair protein RecO (recombination protein O)